MIRSLQNLFVLFILCGVALFPAAGRAQSPGFQCPKPGTVVSAASQATRTYHGADPSDPEVCLATNSVTGKERILFNYVSLPFYVPAEESAARLAMRGVFSGQLREGRYTYTALAGSTVGGATQAPLTRSRVWRRIGPETITVEGKSVDTVVFEQISTSSGRDYVTRSNYDPNSGIWIRIGDTKLDGVPVERGFTRRIIAIP